MAPTNEKTRARDELLDRLDEDDIAAPWAKWRVLTKLRNREVGAAALPQMPMGAVRRFADTHGQLQTE
jgi:hypothetical protein